MTTDSSTRRKRERLLWPDVARGVAVVLVVFHHVTIKDLVPNAGTGESAEILNAAQLAFSSIRMPLFFLLSGVFAASIMRQSLWVVVRDRSLFFYYLYVLWLSIQTVVYLVLRADLTIVAGSPVDFLGQLTVAPSTLWYLWALAVYFPAARLLVRRPTVAIAIALVISVWAGSTLFVTWGNLPSAGRNFIWFVVGLCLTDRVLSLGQAAKGWWLVVLLPVVAAGNLLSPSLPRDLTAVLQLPLGLIGAVSGIVVASVLAKGSLFVRTTLAWIGRRTLQVYVLHLPLLAATMAIRQALIGPVSFGVLDGLVYGICVTLMLLAATVSLPITRYAPWLLAPPWVASKK